jgi:hypothetical protein
MTFNLWSRRKPVVGALVAARVPFLVHQQEVCVNQGDRGVVLAVTGGPPDQYGLRNYCGKVYLTRWRCVIDVSNLGSWRVQHKPKPRVSMAVEACLMADEVGAAVKIALDDAKTSRLSK